MWQVIKYNDAIDEEKEPYIKFDELDQNAELHLCR